MISVETITAQLIRYRLFQILTNKKEIKISDLPDPESILDDQLLNKLRNMYKSCVNYKEGQIEALYPLFRAIRQWVPLSGQTDEGLKAALAYLTERGVWTLFEMKVGPDEGAKKPALYLLPPPVSKYSEKYLQTVIDILELVFRQDREFGWKSWSPVATARRIIEFEQQWIMPDDKKEQWTWQAIQNEVPFIEWKSLGRHIVAQPSLVKAMKENVRGTNGRTLQMYLIWRVLWTFLDTVGYPYVEPKRRFETETLGIRAIPERWESCLTTLEDSSMGLLLGRYYMLDRKELFIEPVQDLIKSIVRKVEDRLQSEEAVRKLKSLQFEIGYPSVIRSVIPLSESFGEMAIDDQDFLQNMMNDRMHHVKEIERQAQLDELISVFLPTRTSVDYRSDYHQVVIPAGVLQFPFNGQHSPDYVSQSTLGWMIGQAVMHALIDKNASSSEAESCLKTQYESFGLNGEETLKSNMADNKAFIMDDIVSNVTLPGLDQWTREQLFYIQFARMRCSKSTKEYETFQRDQSPDRYRVNVPLMNSHHFSKAFQCRLGSFMNPEHKCQVW
ncbi:hypothetical protein RMCBS344292_04829 [Rhizopus microsporus]|nr:hypothetical protein RMCBS344292_04829 [Rhizopus microsporus]